MKIKPEEQENRILKTLYTRGAMSPGEISANTWLMPGDTLSALKRLANSGQILLRPDSQNPDGLMAALKKDVRDSM